MAADSLRGCPWRPEYLAICTTLLKEAIVKETHPVMEAVLLSRFFVQSTCEKRHIHQSLLEPLKPQNHVRSHTHVDQIRTHNGFNKLISSVPSLKYNVHITHAELTWFTEGRHP